MSAVLWWTQTLVIAVVVLAAAFVAVRRLLPIPSRRWQARFVESLAASPLPPSLRAFMLRAQPKATTGASCGDGCSTCGGCGAAASTGVSARDEAAHPLVFHRRAPLPPK